MSDTKTLPIRAGILCNDADFRRFVGERTIGKGHMVTPEAAAEHLRRACSIASRRVLADDQDAAARFLALLTDFDAWRGKIAAPR